jgi:hypothetical protein
MLLPLFGDSIEVCYRSLPDVRNATNDINGCCWLGLVVHASVRKRHIATQLLQTLQTHPLFYDITAIGLISSHPAACSALSKYASEHLPYYLPIEFLTNENGGCQTQRDRHQLHR